ncbi:MAG: YceD family protein [Oscillospiraceae bacterium]
MQIDIANLHSGLEDFITIDEIYSFNKEMLKNTEIIELNDVKITGDITKNSLDEYIIDVVVTGTMVLPCALTLKPVNYNFGTEITGNLAQIFEEFGENYENNQKTIDILPIIWENILMEIPIKVVSDDISDVKTKGDGWELITDEEVVNPSLAKLKDLL